MVAEEIVFTAVVESRLQNAAFGCSHRPVVIEELFRECACLPSLEPSHADGDPVDATQLARRIASDVFETRPAKQLAVTGDILFVVEAVFQSLEINLPHRGSSDAEAVTFFKLS